MISEPPVLLTVVVTSDPHFATWSVWNEVGAVQIVHHPCMSTGQRER